MNQAARDINVGLAISAIASDTADGLMSAADKEAFDMAVASLPESVLTHGAADGAADSTAGFVGAMAAAAASGRPVVVPPGTYNVTGLTMSTSGMSMVGSGATKTIVKLSATAAALLSITVDDVSVTGIKLDGNAKVSGSNGVVSLAGKRFCPDGCIVTGGAIGVGVSAGAGIMCDRGVRVDGVTTAAIQVTDYADISRLTGVFNSAPCAAPMMKLVAGTNTARDFIDIKHCKWTVSSGDSLALTCQQPVRISVSSFNADAKLTPTATFGVERVVATENSFTNSGAVGFYDSGTPGVLSTYTGLTDTNNYKAP